QLSQTFEGHRKSISAIAALPSTQRMVTTSLKDKTLCLWELTTKKLLKHLVGHPSVVSGLAVHISLDFSADGTTLASAGDRTVKFWCTTAWKENQDAIHLDAVVHCVRYSSSGELLAIATENSIYIYNSATRQRIKTLKGHSGGTFALTWTLQGTYLLSGGGERDPTVRVWEVLRGDEIDTFRGHTDKISAIAVDDSSTIITSASSDGSVRLW
ncbi:WD40-repeat-containing domain protein, partial [Suillus americanus]